jgi:putative restriction endonuclease
VWHLEGLPRSYLQQGYCSAALRSLQQFRIEHRHEQTLLDTFEAGAGDEAVLAERLNREPRYPRFLRKEIEGKEALRLAKARVNKAAFRKIRFRRRIGAHTDSVRGNAKRGNTRCRDLLKLNH